MEILQPCEYLKTDLACGSKTSVEKKNSKTRKKKNTSTNTKKNMQGKKAKTPKILPYNPFVIGLVQTKPPSPKRVPSETVVNNAILEEVVEEKGIVSFQQNETPPAPVKSLTMEELESIFGPLDRENAQQQYQEDQHDDENPNRLVRVYNNDHQEEDELLQLLEDTNFYQLVTPYPLSENQIECVDDSNINNYIRVISRLKKRVEGKHTQTDDMEHPKNMTKEEIEVLFQWVLDVLSKKADDADKLRRMNVQVDEMYAHCEVTYPSSGEEDQIMSPLENVEELTFSDKEDEECKSSSMEEDEGCEGSSSVENAERLSILEKEQETFSPESELQPRSLLEESILHINDSVREDVVTQKDEKLNAVDELIFGKRKRKRKPRSVYSLVWQNNNADGKRKRKRKSTKVFNNEERDLVQAKIHMFFSCTVTSKKH
jgi:hypothetical protein